MAYHDTAVWMERVRRVAEGGHPCRTRADPGAAQALALHGADKNKARLLSLALLRGPIAGSLA